MMTMSARTACSPQGVLARHAFIAIVSIDPPPRASGEMVAPDWDATSWSVSVIRVSDATYRAAFAEARRIATGEMSPTLFSVSLETAGPNGPGFLRLFGTDLNMEGLELQPDSHAAKREMFAEFFSRDRNAVA
jgi:hypothetical protein